ncbi:YkvA family protein [Salinisphaera aquimarina]|uniref:YkvA family protein n=1 Tax=Salinisphaera aquimarina TaxID=2094031 RepID=A0ABV7EK71_9GAMM
MALATLKTQAHQIKKHTLTVFFAARDPRTPVVVRLLAALVAAYALSPIDLIPDFIPVIGYLDDLLLVPLGLALVVRLTPPAVMKSAQLQAERAARQPISYTAAAVFVLIWGFLVWMFASWVFNAVRS